MATSFSGLNNSPYALYFARGAVTLLGTLGFTMGCRALISPKASAELFGFNPSSATVLSANSNPFIPITGGRTMGFSLALLIAVSLKMDRAVGVMLSTGWITGLIDGLSVVKYADSDDKKAMQAAYGHWGLPLIGTALGIWLFVKG